MGCVGEHCFETALSWEELPFVFILSNLCRHHKPILSVFWASFVAEWQYLIWSIFDLQKNLFKNVNKLKMYFSAYSEITLLSCCELLSLIHSIGILTVSLFQFMHYSELFVIIFLFWFWRQFKCCCCIVFFFSGNTTTQQALQQIYILTKIIKNQFSFVYDYLTKGQ